jgi:hypothetical protein
MVSVATLALLTCSLVHNATCREYFVCVEPGYVRGFKRLDPGEKWIGQQVLVVV